MKEIFFCTRSRSKDFNKQLHLFAQIEILMRCVFDKLALGHHFDQIGKLYVQCFYELCIELKKKRIISKHCKILYLIFRYIC